MVDEAVNIWVPDRLCVTVLERVCDTLSVCETVCEPVIDLVCVAVGECVGVIVVVAVDSWLEVDDGVSVRLGLRDGLDVCVCDGVCFCVTDPEPCCDTVDVLL